MGLTEIQKQTIAQQDKISIRAIAAEVGVHKFTVLLAKQKIKPIIRVDQEGLFKLVTLNCILNHITGVLSVVDGLSLLMLSDICQINQQIYPVAVL
jgi:hypothetical protein